MDDKKIAMELTKLAKNLTAATRLRDVMELDEIRRMDQQFDRWLKASMRDGFWDDEDAFREDVNDWVFGQAPEHVGDTAEAYNALTDRLVDENVDRAIEAS